MSWALKFITQLKSGETIQIRPLGNSMKGRIEPGQLVTIAPASVTDVKVGDIVLCSVDGNDFLHIVHATKMSGVIIKNNKGHVNGFTSRIYGKVVAIED